MRRLKQAWELARDFREGVEDPVEHAYKVLENIMRWEAKINAYISLEAPELIVEGVEHVAKSIKVGERLGRLAGLLVSVKDNICTSSLPTTAGSRMLDPHISPYNATVIERMLREYAIVVGKTNLDEFAMGSTTELSAFGPTRNPWDIERVPGGSSGGSAASLAYGGAYLALGSDTGGSARLPAAYTATVGLKPTYGLVSRYGLIAYGSSLDQISPMARSVRDVALLLDVIGGWDPLDATSLRVERPTTFAVDIAEPRKVTICIVRELSQGAEEVIERTFWATLKKLESEGVELREEKMPVISKALQAYYTIAMAEAASNLARYDGVLYPMKGGGNTWDNDVEMARMKGFGREVKKRILMGVYALSEGYRDEYYMTATRIRRAIRDEVLRIARNCIIASQASPILPPRLGERLDDPLKLYAMDTYTVVANLAGVPSLVQPIGFHEGLPIGIQWIGGPLGEGRLISLGLLVEEITGLRGVVAD